MAPATASTWDHAADKDLLLTIIDEGGPGAAKWALISDKMQAKGYSFTKEACRQHFQKIRKESRNGGSGSATPVRKIATPRAPRGTASVNSTPRKGKFMTDSFQSTNGSASGNGYDEEDDEEMTTPAKRKRTVKKEEDGSQTAPLFKIEGEGVEAKPIDLEHEELYYDDENQYA